MNSLDLRQLRYFVAVAEELHFGRAALRLHISQPPLSQQIAGLEATLGVKLFMRNRRKVEITSAGEQLLKDAKGILSQARAAASNAQAAAAGRIGQLRIGLNYTSPLTPALARILREFSRRYPLVGLELFENSSPKQLDGLRRDSLDVSFVWVTQHEMTKGIALRPLSRDVLYMAMRRDHPLARRKRIEIEDLQEFPIFLAIRQTQTSFFDALMTAFGKAGMKPDLRTDIHQLPFILNLLATGFGVSFLPEFFGRLKIDEVILKPCPFLPKDKCHMTLALAYRDDDASSLVKSFVKTALDLKP